MARNIKLTIEYDGTGYHGWQSQINADTVQNAIQVALKELTGENCKLTGSGRTDTGVHALGQVANFHTGSTIPAEKFAVALNGVLPDDIVIKGSEEVSIGFHSRYDAKGKKYRYLINNSPYPSALLRNRACHVPYPLDCGLMRDASLFFIGTHDFAAFKASGGTVKSTVKTITQLILDKKADIIELDICADGFLYNMARIIAGTLIEVGKGRIAPDSVPGIIDGRDRKKAGKTATACGLYLVEAYY